MAKTTLCSWGSECFYRLPQIGWFVSTGFGPRFFKYKFLTYYTVVYSESISGVGYLVFLKQQILEVCTHQLPDKHLDPRDSVIIAIQVILAALSSKSPWNPHAGHFSTWRKDIFWSTNRQTKVSCTPTLLNLLDQDRSWKPLGT